MKRQPERRSTAGFSLSVSYDALIERVHKAKAVRDRTLSGVWCLGLAILGWAFGRKKAACQECNAKTAKIQTG